VIALLRLLSVLQLGTCGCGGNDHRSMGQCFMGWAIFARKIFTHRSKKLL